MSTSDGWQRVKFGDVVRNVSETVADPVAAGLEHAVGLEHLEPGELAITRWASTEDGLTFTRRFRAGQVLFGRRRVYQCKVAIPDFDGVCSGDIYVLESSTDSLLPELLPFVVQSEPFFENALRTSAGSLSPRTKWTDLKNYEFDLPPIDEQREIANLLWAVERSRREWSVTKSALSTARTRFFDHLLASAPTSTVQLGDLLDSVQYGTSKRCIEQPEDGDVPVLRIPNILSGRLDLSDLKWAHFTASEYDRYKVSLGDVLLVRTNGNPEYVGRGLALGASVPAGAVFASYLIRLCARRELLAPEFLEAILDAPSFRVALRPSIRSSAGNYNLNSTNIKKQTVRLPTLDVQSEIIAQLAELDSVRETVDQHIARLDSLKRAAARDSLSRR